MPRRNVNLTVVLGDGPNTTPISGSWDHGVAVAANGNDEFGMIIGKVAGEGDDILGWTVKNQLSGDIASLRTMLDGTIYAKIEGVVSEPYGGVPVRLSSSGDGSLTTDTGGGYTDAKSIGWIMESGVTSNRLAEVFIHTQKYATL